MRSYQAYQIALPSSIPSGTYNFSFYTQLPNGNYQFNFEYDSQTSFVIPNIQSLWRVNGLSPTGETLFSQVLPGDISGVNADNEAIAFSSNIAVPGLNDIPSVQMYLLVWNK